MSCAMNAFAARRANFLELWRASWPMTTPSDATSGWLFRMYLAKPCDVWMTVKEFMQEKPAAIRPRRPAVPNWMPNAAGKSQNSYWSVLYISPCYTYAAGDAARAPQRHENPAAVQSQPEWWDPTCHISQSHQDGVDSTWSHSSQF